MVKIICELFAEAARGNVYTHMVRLIQFRAYGNHVGEHNWLQTLTAFKRGLPIQVQPDKFPACIKRGEQYAMFMNDGVGVINQTLDFITTAYTQMFTNLGVATTGNSQCTCRRHHL